MGLYGNPSPTSTSTRPAPKPAATGRYEYVRRDVVSRQEEVLEIDDDTLDLTEVHDALAASRDEVTRLKAQARLGTGQGQASAAGTREARMEQASRDLEAYYARQGIKPDGTGTGQTSGTDRQAAADCSRFFKSGRQVASTRLPAKVGQLYELPGSMARRG